MKKPNSAKTENRKRHICKEIDYCTCDSMALEPNEQCIKHGAGPWPPRCMICGRFMSWPKQVLHIYIKGYENVHIR